MRRSILRSSPFPRDCSGTADSTWRPNSSFVQASVLRVFFWKSFTPILREGGLSAFIVCLMRHTAVQTSAAEVLWRWRPHSSLQTCCYLSTDSRPPTVAAQTRNGRVCPRRHSPAVVLTLSALFSLLAPNASVARKYFLLFPGRITTLFAFIHATGVWDFPHRAFELCFSVDVSKDVVVSFSGSSEFIFNRAERRFWNIDSDSPGPVCF